MKKGLSRKLTNLRGVQVSNRPLSPGKSQAIRAACHRL